MLRHPLFGHIPSRREYEEHDRRHGRSRPRFDIFEWLLIIVALGVAGIAVVGTTSVVLLIVFRRNARLRQMRNRRVESWREDSDFDLNFDLDEGDDR